MAICSISIGFSQDTKNSIEDIRTNLDSAADTLQRSEALHLESKRLLLENARLLRKLVGMPGALHIADREESESDTATDRE